jgi:hypothetical protein
MLVPSSSSRGLGGRWYLWDGAGATISTRQDHREHSHSSVPGMATPMPAAPPASAISVSAARAAPTMTGLVGEIPP